ncbi:MAG: transposase, partial [Ignavibacteria bacterium]|nr:transposase [Ignavibacteria bacterium]
NRGVEKRNIFQEVSDYFRFIFCLYECNDKNPVIMRKRIDQRRKKKNIGVTYAVSDRVERVPLVEILVFCLMPNHFHLVLRQLTDNGISLFMKKLGDAYVGYFNKKHQRVGMGSLFQGSFKAVHIKTNGQLINVVCYIFTNPIELLEKTWKETGIGNPQKAIEYLNSYHWSSYLDYVGKKNFPSVTNRDFLLKVFNGSDNIKKFVEGQILSKAELNKSFSQIKTLILED